MVKSIFPFCAAGAALLIPQCASFHGKPPASGKPFQVSVSATSFNPSRNKSVEIKAKLPAGSQASVFVMEAHGLPVRTLFAGETPRNGDMAWKWDGRDDSGAVVPDEAYTLRIVCVRGRDTMTYDPPAFSGGETFTITNAEVDLGQGTIAYALEKDSRVMIRAGEKKGLLVKSIAHLSPRLKGRVTEYWNGKDADNLLSVKDIEGWVLVISGFSLPENAIITYGNKQTTYPEYVRRRFPREAAAMDFPLTAPAFLAAMGNRKNVTMHVFQPLLRDYPPRVDIEFPNSAESTREGTPVLRGNQRVLIDIDASDPVFKRDQQFEVCFFIDGKFIAEDELGYVPYNWIWNLAEVPEGEHIVTVNLASFRDQIGTRSVKVLVKR